MWRLCGKLWTWTLKWTLKREELLSSRIEFNRQRIVLYSSLSLSLFLASFVIHAFIRQTMHGYCSIIFITFRHHFHRVCPLLHTLFIPCPIIRAVLDAFFSSLFFWIKKMSIQEINIYFSTNKWNKCIWPFSLKSHNLCRWIFNATIEKYFFFFQITIYRAIFHRENFLSNFHDQSSLPVPPRSRLKIELYFWYRAI